MGSQTPQVKQGRNSLSINSSRIDRGQVIAGIVLVCVVVIAWIAFELGQSRAGFNSFEAGERQRELKATVEEANEELHLLRERIAQLETDRKIDSEAYAQVEDELASLEATIVTQQEDLEFYRGIVSDQQAGVRIQDFVLWPGDVLLSYSMRLVLAQEMRAGSRISGSVTLEIEGVQGDERLTLDLSELLAGGGGKKQLDFSFRYFQNLEAELVLPDGFSPERVNVRLKPRGKSAKSVEKSFDWVVKAG